MAMQNYVYIESTSKTARGVSFKARDDESARKEIERLSGRSVAPYVRLFRKELNKSEWPEGPWSSEPDRVEWRAPNGLPCLIVRGPVGGLCGYVGVPPGHRFHGGYYEQPDVDVHGGLTYSSSCRGEICHVAQPGEPEHVWWLGFDCAHAGDRVPGLGYFHDDDVYRDVEWVKAEVERLAAQLS